MRYLKTYREVNEDILSGVRLDDLNDILMELKDKGFSVEVQNASMRQDWNQITITSPGHRDDFYLSDIQETLCRLYDYSKPFDRDPSVSAVGSQTGMVRLKYHDSIGEYRSPDIRVDTGLNLVIINIPK